MIACNDLKNVQRFWVAPDDSVIRHWTQEEYDTLHPSQCIKEYLKYTICRHCGKLLGVFNSHERYCKRCRILLSFIPRNRGFKEVLTELHCVEIGEREIDNGYVVAVMNKY